MDMAYLTYSELLDLWHETVEAMNQLEVKMVDHETEYGRRIYKALDVQADSLMVLIKKLEKRK